MSLIKNYLEKTETHIFAKGGSSIFQKKEIPVKRKIVSVEIDKVLYAVVIDIGNDIKVQIWDASRNEHTSSAGKVYINPEFKDQILPDNGDYRSFKGGRFYKPLADFVRSKMKQNKETIQNDIQDPGPGRKQVSDLVKQWIIEVPELYERRRLSA